MQAGQQNETNAGWQVLAGPWGAVIPTGHVCYASALMVLCTRCDAALLRNEISSKAQCGCSIMRLERCTELVQEMLQMPQFALSFGSLKYSLRCSKYKFSALSMGHVPGPGRFAHRGGLEVRLVIAGVRLGQLAIVAARPGHGLGPFPCAPADTLPTTSCLLALLIRCRPAHASTGADACQHAVWSASVKSLTAEAGSC